MRRVIPTRHGPIEVDVSPPGLDPGRPLLLAVSSPRHPGEFDRLPAALGLLGDGAVLRLPPGPAGGALDTATSAGITEDVLDAQFAGRTLVLVGASDGAAACLAVRSPLVARIVAVEPPLGTETLRPLATPTHIVLGRAADRTEEARRAPAAEHPRITLHIVGSARHDLLGAAPEAVIAVLHEAARRAAAVQAFDLRQLDEALLEAAPLAAPRLACWGPGADTFLAAYQARSPAARAVDPASAETFDLLVLGALPSHADLAGLAARLAPGGMVVARRRLGAEAAPPRFAELGLEALEPLEPGGSAILRFSRARPAARLFVQMTAFAPTLLDVRTRLPARFLATAPDLEASCQVAPPAIPPLPADRPKVLLLQRPAERRLDAWRQSVESLAAAGWLVALEFDDHPHLLDAGDEVEALQPFACVHAVQTSTPELAEVFRRFNPEVAVFPNAAFDLAPLPASAPPRRVFYGALNRGAYAAAAAQALAPFTAANPDVEFVVLADREVFEALPTRAKTFHDFAGYERYLALLGQCAVSISPLEAGGVRETKSDAKYLDAARSGVPTIGSPTVYGRTIRHGVNGYIAETLDDWPAILTQAFGDPQALREVGRRAWEHVRDERMFADQVERRRAWYWSLWTRREALTASLWARLQTLAPRS